VLIDPILKGYNGCVFAYGATGTGKTFTMLGTTHSPGLCNLTLKDIFAKINSPLYSDEKYEVKVSYVEIYNEAIRDLLVAKDTGFLDLRDDPVKGVTISGANEVTVNDTEEVEIS
jgi:kinesin family protein 18/19